MKMPLEITKNPNSTILLKLHSQHNIHFNTLNTIITRTIKFQCKSDIDINPTQTSLQHNMHFITLPIELQWHNTMINQAIINNTINKHKKYSTINKKHI
jgi:hypothetical protein